MHDFDIVIIGGTPEGIAAARAARAQGAKIALVEHGSLGGDELQGGRIPTRALLKAARVFTQCQESMEFGIRNENIRVTWSAVKLRIADVQDEIRSLWRKQLKEEGIELLKATVRFKDAHTLQLTGKNGPQALRSPKYIVAISHVPGEPQIQGLAETGSLTPAQLFALPEMPRSLTVLGSDATAVELSFALACLGCKVTVLCPTATLLPGEDEEISGFAEKLLQQAGVVLHTGVDIQCARFDGEKKQVVFVKEGETQHADSRHILPLLAQRLDLTPLNIEAAGVEWSPQTVQADQYLQAAPTVWVCGTGRNATGALAAHNALADSPRSQNECHSARVLFTDPGLASIGLSEAQAHEKWDDVRVFHHKASQLEHAVIEGETRGFVKLVAGNGNRVLGAHIAGRNAGERLTPFILAMQQKEVMPQPPACATLHIISDDEVPLVLARYAQSLTA